MIFDSHVHLCEKGSLKGVCRADSQLPGYRNARENSWESYARVAAKNGVFKALVMPFPFKELSATAADDYICRAVACNPDLLIGLALITPTVSYLESLGTSVVGAKEHFYLTGEQPVRSYFPAYEFLQQNDLVLLIHPRWNERVTRITEIKRSFPQLKVILAHSGRKSPYTGEEVVQVACKLKRFDSLFFDTSTIRDPSAITQLMRMVGSDRVLFGSDFPYFQSKDEDSYGLERAAVEDACLNDQQRHQVFQQTFRNLFLRDVWVRRACKEDTDSLLKIIQKISADERKFLAIDKKLDIIKQEVRSERHVLLLESKDEIVGFARESGRSDNGALVEEIYIKPAHRGKGYAKRLLAAFAAKFDWMEMKTYSTNTNICNLAERFGFAIHKKTPRGSRLTWKWSRRQPDGSRSQRSHNPPS